MLYEVQKGDTIWSIAETSLGAQMPGQPLDPMAIAAEMQKIIGLNMAKLDNNPDLIHSGLVLDIGGTPTPGEAAQKGKDSKDKASKDEGKTEESKGQTSRADIPSNNWNATQPGGPAAPEQPPHFGVLKPPAQVPSTNWNAQQPGGPAAPQPSQRGWGRYAPDYRPSVPAGSWNATQPGGPAGPPVPQAPRADIPAGNWNATQPGGPAGPPAPRLTANIPSGNWNATQPGGPAGPAEPRARGWGRYAPDYVPPPPSVPRGSWNATQPGGPAAPPRRTTSSR